MQFETASWRIPEANRKGRMHAAMGDEVVPLSPAAAAAFKELHELAPDSEWVVASPHRKASSRGHMRETALNKTVYWLLKNRRLEMPRWTPHDARRTARSYWSEKLGIPWDLCERLLGHALPTVARTYDTGSYLEQRRDALEKWAAYLDWIGGSEATRRGEVPQPDREGRAGHPIRGSGGATASSSFPAYSSKR